MKIINLGNDIEIKSIAEDLPDVTKTYNGVTIIAMHGLTAFSYALVPLIEATNNFILFVKIYDKEVSLFSTDENDDIIKGSEFTIHYPKRFHSLEEVHENSAAIFWKLFMELRKNRSGFNSNIAIKLGWILLSYPKDALIGLDV